MTSKKGLPNVYCVKCGVELADSEKKCPLCGTEAFLPNGRGETPYPKFVDEYKKIKPIGVIIILTCLMTLGALLNIIIDLRISLAVTWSGYSVGGILLLYITVVLPMWFTRPNPVIFVPCDFAAATLYLLYVNLSTGGKWFLTLAFPAIGAAALIVTAVIALTRYLKRGFLYIGGGLLIATGGYCMLIEFLIKLTFGGKMKFLWSLYPLTACFILGISMIIAAICTPVRETLKRKLFI